MGKVSLEGLEFFAYHGYYEEEQKIGNKYSVDITVYTNFLEAAEHDTIGGTVNYEVLYRIIKGEMEVSSRLLENICKRIIDKTFTEYPSVDTVEVSVSKFNPPIGGICTKAKISLREDKKKSQY